MHGRWLWALTIVAAALWLMSVPCPAQQKGKAGQQGQQPVKIKSCYQNKRPVIEGVVLLKDEEPLKEPKVAQEDLANLTVGIEYSDPECNIAGGEVLGRIDGGNWEVLLLVDEAYCSSKESKHLIQFPLPGDLSAGEHRIELQLFDICGHKSFPPFGFSLVVVSGEQAEQPPEPAKEQPSKPAPEERKPSGKGK